MRLWSVRGSRRRPSSRLNTSSYVAVQITEMPNIFPDKFPAHGWEKQFDVEAARLLLPDVDELVPHPRYGKAPLLSGDNLSQAVKFGIYQHQPAWIFPATRIRADESKQNYSVFPRTEYFDVLCRCRDCRRWFIFFAKEQQYWYEELRFFVDSICVHCPECRHARRCRHREEQEWALLQKEAQLNSEQMTRLLELTISLWKRGFIQRCHQLDLTIRKALVHDPANRLLEQVRDLRRHWSSE